MDFLSSPYLWTILGALSVLGMQQVSTEISLLIAGISILVVPLIDLLLSYQKNTSSKNILLILLVGFVLWILEMQSSKTGTPYGLFSYNENLIGMILGTPIAMVFVWGVLIQNARHLFPKSLVLGSLCLVFFDLVLDPGAVTLGMWNWVVDGVYYGIPTTNFIGWFVMGILGIYVSRKLKAQTLQPGPLWFSSLGLWGVYTFSQGMIIPGIISIILIVLSLLRNQNKTLNS